MVPPRQEGRRKNNNHIFSQLKLTLNESKKIAPSVITSGNEATSCVTEKSVSSSLTAKCPVAIVKPYNAANDKACSSKYFNKQEESTLRMIQTN